MRFMNSGSLLYGLVDSSMPTSSLLEYSVPILLPVFAYPKVSEPVLVDTN